MSNTLVEIIFDHEARNLLLKIPRNLNDSLFLTTLKFSLGFTETEKNLLSLDVEKFSKSELYDTIRKVVEFFMNEKKKFILNDETKKLLKRAEVEIKRREAIKRTAQTLIKKNFVSTEGLNLINFKRKLKPYQEKPVSFLIKIPYAANFSVPGSGKTTMVYAAYSRLKDLGSIQKILVIGPSVAYLAWSEEYEKCFNAKPNLVRITGSRRSRIKIYEQVNKHEIFITTYQTAVKDIDLLIGLLKSAPFLLVLDESHNIKRFEGGVWASTILRLSDYAHRRIILTGTPIPNTLLDLWSQFYFLDPEIVGTKAQFKILTKKADAEELLRKKLMPYYRRVKKKELDLPKPIFRIIKVKSKKLQAKIYNTIRRASLEELKLVKEEKAILKELRKAIMIRLMQAASNPSLLIEKSEEFNIPSINKDKITKLIDPTIVEIIRKYSKFEIPSKIEVVERLTKSIIKNHPEKKVLIWSVWIKNLKILSKRLQDFNPIIIYGDVPINEEQDEIDNRELRIKRFKTDSSCKVMIANPGACGESISLHDVCHDAIYLDRTFNAGQYMQSLDRIHRVGLKKSDKITYYLFLAADTIDETINRRLEEKRKRMLKLLDDDFKVINLETDLSEVSGVPEDEENDFAAVIKDLK